MKKGSWYVIALALAVALALVVQRTQRSAAGSRHSEPAAGVAPVKKLSTEGMKPVPDLVLKDLNGKSVSLKEYAGKVVLVNFWATWCDPCRTEIPWLIELSQKYGDKGFVVLGVAMDDEGKSAVEPFVQKERFDVNGQKLPMSYPILIGDGDSADAFLKDLGGVLGLPTSVLVSRDGKRVHTIIGPVEPDKLERDIQGLL
ncbi:MAG TPA: TlpA disulfide reductase family protein [Candidatus Binatia bacterium]|nr:TlpA disulfide reductase family protein [Candidatus Binatia bacterium]